MSGNYVIIQSPSEEEEQLNEKKKSTPLNRLQFERYIREKKPYLNPKLKITDLCLDLNTNRSYLSAFINQEYGMNFSRYINCRRLEELEQLRIDPANSKSIGIELVMRAGFSDFRAYLRVKEKEDKMRILKIFE